MGSKSVRKFTYFGYVDVEQSQCSKISITDNFSSLEISFEIQAIIVSTQTLFNECVFFLSDNGRVYAYYHRDQAIFEVESSAESDESSMKWKWIKLEILNFRKKKFENHQWSHWREYCDIRAEDANLSVRRTYIVCTLFGAFFIRNSGNDKCATIQRIYDARKTMTSFHRWKIAGEVLKVHAGNDHVVILCTNGEIFTCGSGNHGELGEGDLESSDEPQRVDMLIDADLKIVDVAVGGWHSCILTEEGDVYGWGWNKCGQLGYAAEYFSIQPVPYPFDIDKKAVAIACNDDCTFVQFDDATSVTFGKCES